RPFAARVVVLGVLEEVFEGDALVDADVAGEAEHAVADDVALDLVGAAGDRQLDRTEHVAVEVAARAVPVALPRHAAGAGDRLGDLPEAPADHRRGQLAERAPGPGRLAGPQLGAHAQG